MFEARSRSVGTCMRTFTASTNFAIEFVGVYTSELGAGLQHAHACRNLAIVKCIDPSHVSRHLLPYTYAFIRDAYRLAGRKGHYTLHRRSSLSNSALQPRSAMVHGHRSVNNCTSLRLAAGCTRAAHDVPTDTCDVQTCMLQACCSAEPALLRSTAFKPGQPCSWCDGLDLR